MIRESGKSDRKLEFGSVPRAATLWELKQKHIISIAIVTRALASGLEEDPSKPRPG